MAFQPPIRTTTPVVRHNFKSIDELLSPIPHSITSTPSQRNGKANFLFFPSFQIESGKYDSSNIFFLSLFRLLIQTKL